jgi:hypothetical protein
LTSKAESARDYVVRMVQHFCPKPDWHVIVQPTVCEDAWPGTGEHDRRSTSFGVSFGELRSLALAMDGHRPFTGQSTADQMAQALTDRLPGRYEVRYRERDMTYEVHRVA